MYDRYCKIRDSKGLRDADVAKGTGISKYVLSDWKRGRSVPKADKLQKIAEFLGVSLDYLMTGKETGQDYFIDEETALMAQKMHDDENIRILFDGVQKISKEDLQFVIDLVNRMDKQNG